MKLHHYNQMMAHLVGRQKFSNGGDAILPKPNPLSPQERNQKVFNDYVDRMKKYLGAGVNMPEWFVKDLIFQKADELGIELKAGGGSIQPRRQYWAGAVGVAAPTLTYPVMLGLAETLGIATAGVGATALSSAVSDKIKENPEILETPQAKAIMMSLGITPTNLFKKPEEAEDLTHKTVTDTPAGTWIGPDAGEIEKEKEKAKERLKPPVTHIPKSGPIDTGHPPLPPEKWTPPDTIPPQIKVEPKGFPIEEPQKPLILHAEAVGIDDIQDVGEKKKVIKILDKQKKEIPKLKTKEQYEKFIKAIENQEVNPRYKPLVLTKEYRDLLKFYVENFHGSDVASASRSIPIKSHTLGKRLKSTEYIASGNIQNLLDIEQGTLSFPDALNELQHNNKEATIKIEDRLEDSGLNKNQYAHLTDLANLIGMDGTNIDQRNALSKKIRELDVKKEIEGKIRSRIHIGDFLKKINFYAQKERYDVAGEGDEAQLIYKERLHKINPGLETIKNKIKGNVQRKASDVDLKLIDAEGRTISLKDDANHAESLRLISLYPENFKDSNTKSLGTIVLVDPVINREILVDEGYHSTNEGILRDFKKKKINIKQVNERLKANHDRIVEIIKDKAKELPHFKNQDKRVVPLQMNNKGIINADMRNIDKNYILGKITEINPNATKVSDLSKKQKAQYESNILDQYVDNAYDFLVQLKDDKGKRIYSRDEIADFLDEFYTPVGTGKKQYRMQRSEGGPIYGKYAKQIAGIS